MPGLIIADGAARVPGGDFGVKLVLRHTVRIQQFRAEAPALVGIARKDLLHIHAVCKIGLHRTVPVEHADVPVARKRLAIQLAVADDEAAASCAVVIAGNGDDGLVVRGCALHMLDFAIGILCKGGPEAGKIAQIDVRKIIGHSLAANLFGNPRNRHAHVFAAVVVAFAHRAVIGKLFQVFLAQQAVGQYPGKSGGIVQEPGAMQQQRLRVRAVHKAVPGQIRRGQSARRLSVCTQAQHLRGRCRRAILARDGFLLRARLARRAGKQQTEKKPEKAPKRLQMQCILQINPQRQRRSRQKTLSKRCQRAKPRRTPYASGSPR